MGCDIHTIVEIRQDGKWQYVEDLPQSFKEQNYRTFACIAGVRDDFGAQVFELKGLPTDISGMHFRFESLRPEEEKIYNSQTVMAFVDSDGNKSERCIKSVEVDNLTYEDIKENVVNHPNPEYLRRYKYPSYSENTDRSKRKYFVCDAYAENGHFETVKYNELYESFENYAKVHLADEYDEDAGDYGYWDVDFSKLGGDYHSASYLTLSELKSANYDRYTAHKYKMDKDFYNVFIAAGGTFPDKFKVVEEPVGTSFITCLREAVYPVVTIMWQPDTVNDDDYAVFKGRRELEAIAAKYHLKSDDDIRIVFAFDN